MNLIILGEKTIEAEKRLEEKDILVPLEIEGYIFYKWNLPLNIKITEDKVFIAFYKKLESSYNMNEYYCKKASVPLSIAEGKNSIVDIYSIMFFLLKL